MLWWQPSPRLSGAKECLQLGTGQCLAWAFCIAFLPHWTLSWVLSVWVCVSLWSCLPLVVKPWAFTTDHCHRGEVVLSLSLSLLVPQLPVYEPWEGLLNHQLGLKSLGSFPCGGIACQMRSRAGCAFYATFMERRQTLLFPKLLLMTLSQTRPARMRQEM